MTFDKPKYHAIRKYLQITNPKTFAQLEEALNDSLKHEYPEKGFDSALRIFWYPEAVDH